MVKFFLLHGCKALQHNSCKWKQTDLEQMDVGI